MGLPRLVSGLRDRHFMHIFIVHPRECSWYIWKASDRGANHDQQFVPLASVGRGKIENLSGSGAWDTWAGKQLY